MARFEGDHWWYRGLRSVIRDAWRRSVRTAMPRLIDVGCGTGANIIALRDVADPIGIDVEPAAIAYCRQRGIQESVIGSAAALPFPDQCFDVALSCDVLSHRSIADKRALLSEAWRVLRPGAVLLINVPAYQWLRSAHDDAVHQDRRFSRRELTGLLREARFVPEWVSHWNAVLLPLAITARVWRAALHGDGSDVEASAAGVLNGTFGAVLSAERWFAANLQLPFGLSIFAIARRPV
jgi:SAM-dependent methyltransferase